MQYQSDSVSQPDSVRFNQIQRNIFLGARAYPRTRAATASRTTRSRTPGRCAQDTWSSSAAQSYRGSGVPRLLGTGDAGSPRWALPGPEDPRQFCGLAHIFPFPELACLTRRDKLASRFRRDRFLLEFSQRPIWYHRSSEILKFHLPISFADFRSVEYQSESISQAWPAPLIFH